jgi:hypothetical protein
MTEAVQVSVSFEVIRGGVIIFVDEAFGNMERWQAIHSHYSSIDHRICPWEKYIDEELRPYYPHTNLRFRRNKAKEIPDATKEFEGVAGGMTQDGHVLPPITFPLLKVLQGRLEIQKKKSI